MISFRDLFSILNLLVCEELETGKCWKQDTGVEWVDFSGVHRNCLRAAWETDYQV